jgi:uncharacterized membrane protein YraQ (UPF0718 family)/copper chaperone CopZ
MNGALFHSFFSSLLELSLEIAPLLLLGLAIAGVLHLFVSEKQVLKHLGDSSWLAIFKGTLFAIPLPLCSCSVVPVVASLRRKGAAAGPSVSFLVAAPQIGADSWLLTHGLLGPVFAMARIVASFVTAIVAGGLLKGVKEKQSLDGKQNSNGTEIRSGNWFKDFLDHVWELFGGLAPNLVTGLLLAALILLIVPEDLLRTVSHDQPFLSMLVMMVIGIPMYVCATASTPIAAALVMKGLDPGAALVFLLTGPATNLVTMTLLKGSLGMRALLVYTASIAGTSLLAGLLLSAMLGGNAASMAQHLHDHVEGVAWWRWASLVLMLLMLAAWYVQRYRPRSRKKAAADELSLRVEGMTCTHCAARVRNCLEAEGDVLDVDVDLGGGRAKIRLSGGTPSRTRVEEIRQKVIEAGYSASLDNSKE